MIFNFSLYKSSFDLKFSTCTGTSGSVVNNTKSGVANLPKKSISPGMRIPASKISNNFFSFVNKILIKLLKI